MQDDKIKWTNFAVFGLQITNWEALWVQSEFRKLYGCNQMHLSETGVDMFFGEVECQIL